MAGFTPNEGEEYICQQVYGTADAGDFSLVLITNTTASETTVNADLVQPSGGGYATKTLARGSFSGANGQRSYTAQDFTAAGASWIGVTGYAIVTKEATPRILHLQFENAADPAAGAVTVADGGTYRVTMNAQAD